MRKCFALMIAVATVGIFAETACAKIREIGFHSKTEVRDACGNVGGKWNSDGLIYQCVNENCNGKGGSCSVTCNEETKTCIGSTPSLVTPPPGKFDIVKILKGSPARPPGEGLLDPIRGGSPHGPSGMGMPKPSAPPAGKLY